MKLSLRFFNSANLRLAALTLFAVTLPFGFKLTSVINNICIMFLALQWLLEWIRGRPAGIVFRRRRLFIYPIVYYAVFLLGITYSMNFSEGVFELEKKLAILFLPLSLGAGPLVNRHQLRLISKAFIFSCFIAAIICVFWAVQRNYAEGYSVGYLYDAIIHDTFIQGRYRYFNFWYFTYRLFSEPVAMHPVYFSMYLLFSSCLGIYVWWQSTRSLRRVLLLAFLSFNFLCILLLSSRTQVGLAVLLFSLFIISQFWRRRRLIYGILLVIALAGVLLSVVFLNPVIRERMITAMNPKTHFTENKFGEGGLSLRAYKWKYAVEAISLNPVFGAGTGAGQDVLNAVYEKNHFKIGLDHNFNTHNQYLQNALVTGVAGLLVFLLWLFVPAAQVWRGGDWLFLSLLTIFAVSCLTEAMLETNKGVAFFSFFYAVLAGNFYQRIDSGSAETIKGAQRSV